MKPEEYYLKIQTILEEKNLSQTEISEMIDFLKESAADSGIDEETWLESLGTPEQTAADFLILNQPSESRPSTDARQPDLPPIPGSKPDFKKKESVERFGPIDEDHIPENYRREESAQEQTPEPEPGTNECSFRADEYSMDKDENPDGHVRILFKDDPQFSGLNRVNIDLFNADLYIGQSEHPRIELSGYDRVLEIRFRNQTLKIDQGPNISFLPIRNKKLKITVWLPLGLQLEKIKVDGVNASAIVEGIQAESLLADCVNGSFTASTVQVRKLKISNVNGRIHVTNSSFLKASADNVSGQIDLQVPADLRIHAETVSGHISADGILSPYSYRKPLVGSELNYQPASPAGKVKLSSVSGSIHLWI